MKTESISKEKIFGSPKRLKALFPSNKEEVRTPEKKRKSFAQAYKGGK